MDLAGPSGKPRHVLLHRVAHAVPLQTRKSVLQVQIEEGENQPTVLLYGLLEDPPEVHQHIGAARHRDAILAHTQEERLRPTPKSMTASHST